MPSRRQILHAGSVGAIGLLSGCATSRARSVQVDVLLQNDDTKQWPLTVVVERDGKEVFQTETVVPADDGTLGETSIENAFTGTLSDQFTVHVTLDEEQVGTFEYEITCEDDNRFSVLIMHEPFGSGDPISFVAARCS